MEDIDREKERGKVAKLKGDRDKGRKGERVRQGGREKATEIDREGRRETKRNREKERNINTI